MHILKSQRKLRGSKSLRSSRASWMLWSCLNLKDRNSTWGPVKRKNYSRSSLPRRSSSSNFPEHGTHSWRTTKQQLTSAWRNLRPDIRRSWRSCTQTSRSHKSSTRRRFTTWGNECQCWPIRGTTMRLISTRRFLMRWSQRRKIRSCERCERT